MSSSIDLRQRARCLNLFPSTCRPWRRKLVTFDHLDAVSQGLVANQPQFRRERDETHVALKQFRRVVYEKSLRSVGTLVIEFHQANATLVVLIFPGLVTFGEKLFVVIRGWGHFLQQVRRRGDQRTAEPVVQAPPGRTDSRAAERRRCCIP